LDQQEHALLDSALHFFQTTWSTYVFANIGRVPNVETKHSMFVLKAVFMGDTQSPHWLLMILMNYK